MTTPQHLTSLLRDALPAYRITHDDKTVVNIYAPADHGPPMIRVLIDDGCIEVRQRRDAQWRIATICDDAGHAVRVITTALWGTT